MDRGRQQATARRVAARIRQLKTMAIADGLRLWPQENGDILITDQEGSPLAMVEDGDVGELGFDAGRALR